MFKILLLVPVLNIRCQIFFKCCMRGVIGKRRFGILLGYYGMECIGIADGKFCQKAMCWSLIDVLDFLINCHKLRKTFSKFY